MAKPPSGAATSNGSILRRIAGWGLVVVGTLLALVGIFWVGVYIHGIVEVMGAVDRSWLFWGLAILLLGMGLAVSGGTMVVVGRFLLRSS